MLYLISVWSGGVGSWSLVLSSSRKAERSDYISGRPCLVIVTKPEREGGHLKGTMHGWG